MSNQIIKWRLRRHHPEEAFSLADIDTIGRVVSIYDGDTFAVCFPFKNGRRNYVTTTIRILGIDAPEMRPTASSGTAEHRQTEHQLAEEARTTLCQLIGADATTMPRHISEAVDIHTQIRYAFVRINIKSADKYGGRWLANVHTMDGTDIAQEMIHRGKAIPYEGKTKKNVVDELAQVAITSA